MLDQTAIGRLPAHRRRAHGLARTWQAGELFNDLTVAENLMVAAYPWNVRAAFHDIVRRSGKKSPAVDDALTLLGLDEVAHRKPTELSLGQQRLVGVGRALVGDTSVVLLDEPAAGLDTHESAAFGEDVRRVAASGIGVLLIDHDMSLVLKVCDYLYVMDFGHIIAEGPPDQVQRDERVIAAYLGVVDEEAVVQE
jgi:branched-chain amino acid transport system ATP-binding protein